MPLSCADASRPLVAKAPQMSNAGWPSGDAVDMPSPTLATRAWNAIKHAIQAAIRPPDRRGNELGGLEGLKERPWPQQPLLLAPRSFLITALDFKGSLAQVAVPVAVEAGVVEA